MRHIFEYLINRKLTPKDYNHRIREYEVVDLGLPSGTKWATCNIGARTPEEPGLLFQWGRVDGYEYGDNNHEFLNMNDEYVSTSGEKYDAYDITLKQEDDAAYNATNGKLRMPTRNEIFELTYNTIIELTELNGVSGAKFTSEKDKSKWIFIPCTGCFYKNKFVKQINDHPESIIFSCNSSKYSKCKPHILVTKYNGADLYVSDIYNAYPVRGVCK